MPRDHRLNLSWIATRVVLLLLVNAPIVGGRILFGDARLYRRWAHGILTWSHVPYRDFAWEYPPAAAVAIVPPGLAPYYYRGLLVAEMLLVDLLVFVALRRLARRLGSDAGVWLWVVGGALMGPILFTRYDSLAALFAVLAATLGPLAGVWLGLGIAAKLWPAVLLLAVPFVRERRRLLLGLAASLSAVVLVVLAIGGARHGGAIFEHQADRGLQVESVAATPLVIAHRAHVPIDISLYPSSGSWDVTGPGTSVALTVSNVATVAAGAFVLLLAWRVRRRPELWRDLVATALLLVVVTGKVLSPQYVVWLLAALAIALCRRGSPMGVPAGLVAFAALLGQYVYPMYYRDLVNGRGLVVVIVLLVRNAELLAATAVAVAAMWSLTRGEQAA